jgi:hypothetical protein
MGGQASGGEEDGTEAGGTVAESPRAKGATGQPPVDGPDPTADTGATAGTGATGATGTPTEASTRRPASQSTGGQASVAGSSLSLTTAADALRDEEVTRTRWFIRMGWAISVAAMGAVPLVDAPAVMDALFIAAMLLGIAVSAVFHRRFADPARYDERSLLVLSVRSVINAHVAVLYFGTFSLAPVIVVVGIHFVARTDSERVARWIYLVAVDRVRLDHDALLAVALAKSRDARFQSGAELAAAFAAAERGELDDAIRKRARVIQRAMPWRELEQGSQQSGPPVRQ